MIIVEDRYHGAYSGGEWLAFYNHTLPEEIGSDDSTEMNFWATISPDYLVGRGDTPNEARANLIEQAQDLCEAHGF